ncbi:hypothetical protein BCEP4_250039 [Burkholderia cepacia]|nr:hypothetical protein BCEP4_250039 [Burkholderia cepacia]
MGHGSVLFRTRSHEKGKRNAQDESVHRAIVVSTVRMLHGLEPEVPLRSVWPNLMLYAAQAI